VATQTTPRGGAIDDARDLELLKKLAVARKSLIAQIGRRIIGHQEVVENLVAAILAGGHVMIVGVPGLAKTLLVQTVSEALDLSFSRVQFTPDLMPSDITGTELLEEDHATGRRVFKFVKGPIFGNVVLADEINRAPPKTQAALLQAMQEKTVTVAGQTYKLPAPFFVLATQNPIEQEATYPLPEAQLDRFMFELRVVYPSVDEEELIVSSTTTDTEAVIQPVLSGQEVLELQHLVRRIPAPPTLVKFAVGLARATRPSEPTALGDIRKYLSYGAGPRAGQYLVLGAKARAAMDGRSVPDLDDIRAIAMAVLRHRVVLNFQAEAEGVSADQLVGQVLKS
jgi:MoxR-like ATPase